MSDLRELYQQVILDHSKRPRNFHPLPDATRHAEGYNPLCGDRVTVYLKLHDHTIADASFTGSGCAICTASASIMTQQVKGHTVEQAQQSFATFRDLVTGHIQTDQVPDELDKMTVFAGVSEFPMRVKCATLPWHTMKQALSGTTDVVSTE